MSFVRIYLSFALNVVKTKVFISGQDLHRGRMLPDFQVRFTEGKPLAGGHYSQLLRMVDTVREKVVVVKRVPILEHVFWWEREVTALTGLMHPNIVTLLQEPIHIDQSIYLVMEEMDEDLRGYIRRKIPTMPFTCFSLIRAFLQILRGLSYMHGLNWLHRDLKPQNLG